MAAQTALGAEAWAEAARRSLAPPCRRGAVGGVRVALTAIVLVLAACRSPLAAAAPRDYAFSGSITRPVLDNYLSRAVTYSEFLHGIGNVEDNLRFLTNTGTKLVGRAIYRWGGESQLPSLLAKAKPIVAQSHAADPDLVFQAACFEIVTRDVEKLAVPEWVLREFGQAPDPRPFRYEDMLYPKGQWGRDHWGKDASVPDMSQVETRMWFVYLAAAYLDLGIEAIHFGQVEIMDNRDPDHAHWRDMMGRIRAYAARHARRKLVLCDAHVPSGGIVHDGRLMFDFHSFPLRVAEVVDMPQHGELRLGYLDTIYGKSKGGLTPSGWSCEHLPYLVELDNYGVSPKPGQPGTAYFTWGYDEICWFARQSESYRNHWLRYAWAWVREHDPNGWLQMPGSRTLAAPAGDLHWYWANTRSAATPTGFNQEETIKAIWAEPVSRDYRRPPGDRR